MDAYFLFSFFFSAAGTSSKALNQALDTLLAISRINFAIKSWRREVWDAFMDVKFFKMSLETGKKWATILRVLIISDKDRIVDLISRFPFIFLFYFFILFFS